MDKFILTVFIVDTFFQHVLSLEPGLNNTITRRTFSTFKEKFQDGHLFYQEKGLFGFKDLTGPRLELDFVLPFVKLPIFGVGPLIELDIQSITTGLTAVIFLYIVPKILFLLYPNTVETSTDPDRGERSFNMPLYLQSIEEFLRTYVVPTDHCSSTNSSYLSANSTNSKNVYQRKFLLDYN